MQYNRKLRSALQGRERLCTGRNLRSCGLNLAEKLKTPVRGAETLEQYLALPKSQQDELKDVGGFVGGTFEGDRRKAAGVVGRDLITLDLDNIPAGQTDDILRRVGRPRMRGRGL